MKLTVKQVHKFVLNKLKEELRNILIELWEESEEPIPFEEYFAEELKRIKEDDSIWSLLNLLDDFGYDDTSKLDILISVVLEEEVSS